MNSWNQLVNYRGMWFFLFLVPWWITFTYFSYCYGNHSFAFIFLLLILLSLVVIILVFDYPAQYLYANHRKKKYDRFEYYVTLFRKLINVTREVYLLWFPLTLLIASFVEIISSFYFVHMLGSAISFINQDSALVWVKVTIIVFACFNLFFFALFSVIFFYFNFDKVVGQSQMLNSYKNNFFLGFNISNYYFCKRDDILADKNFKKIPLYLLQNANYVEKSGMNRLTRLTAFSNVCFTFLKFLCIGIFSTIVVSIIMAQWSAVGISGTLALFFFGTEFTLIFNYDSNKQRVDAFGGKEYEQIQIVNEVDEDLSKLKLHEKMNVVDLYILLLSYLIKNFHYEQYEDLLGSTAQIYVHFPFLLNKIQLFVEFMINIDEDKVLTFTLYKMDFLPVILTQDKQKIVDIFLFNNHYEDQLEWKENRQEKLVETVKPMNLIKKNFGQDQELNNLYFSQNSAAIMIPHNDETNRLIFYANFSEKFKGASINHLNLDFNLIIDYIKSEVVKDELVSINDLQIRIFSQQVLFKNIDFYAYHLINVDSSKNICLFSKEINVLKALNSLLDLKQPNTVVDFVA